MNSWKFLQDELKNGIKEEFNCKFSDFAVKQDLVVQEINELKVEVKANQSQFNELQAELSGVKDGQLKLEHEVHALEAKVKEVNELSEQQFKTIPQFVESGVQNLKEEMTVLCERVTAIETGARAISGGSVFTTAKVKAPRFDGTTSWRTFKTQFETVCQHNGWSAGEKAVHLIAGLHGRAAEVLHSVQQGAKYEDILAVLDGRYGDHQLAAAYRVQMRNRTQRGNESLQEFAAEVEQLDHMALDGLPQDHIQREAAYTFIDGLRDTEIRQHLMLGGEQNLREALAKALRMEAAKGTTAPSPRVRIVNEDTPEVRRGAAERRTPPPRRRSTREITCWDCGKQGHIRRNCPEGAAPEQGNE